jgi:hypothetical protein
MALGLRFFWTALSGIAGYFPRFPPAHPTKYLTGQQGIYDHPNPPFLAVNPRDIVYKCLPAPFALIFNPLAHSRKSVVVLGESGAAILANSDPHLPSLGLFQPSLTRIKPVADTRG